MTLHLDNYRCSAEVMGSFQETAPRKTTKNTIKHHDGGVGLVVANHRGGGESLVVVTTLASTDSRCGLSKVEILHTRRHHHGHQELV